MSTEAEIIIAGFVALLTLVSVIGGLVARDRYVQRMIKDETDRLHTRINSVQDRFVRRDDLDQHIVRIESFMNKLETRMDDLIRAITNLNVKRD